MKAKLFVFLLFIIVAGLSVFIFMNVKHTQSSQALWEQYQVIKKTINGEELRLVVANSPEQYEKGLMFVTKPVSDFDGMIFIFPDSQMRTFWNKNTLVDLTLYWMNSDTIIGKSELPSITKSKNIVTVSSPKPANTVVEVIK